MTAPWPNFAEMSPEFQRACLVAAVPAVTAASWDDTCLAELIRRSAETNLADTHEWHLLLHYRANVLGRN
jgi:hypothetical protein